MEEGSQGIILAYLIKSFKENNKFNSNLINICAFIATGVVESGVGNIKIMIARKYVTKRLKVNLKRRQLVCCRGKTCITAFWQSKTYR